MFQTFVHIRMDMCKLAGKSIQFNGGRFQALHYELKNVLHPVYIEVTSSESLEYRYVQ